MPSIPTRSCGSPGLINVSALVQALAPAPWSGMRQISNRDLPPLSAASLIPSAALRHELIDWGTAVVARHAAQAAGRVVPCMTLIHQAFQAYRALSAAQQGDLFRAVQQLPLSAIIPAAVLELLRNALPQGVDSAIQSLPEHDGVVLLLAAGALLSHLDAPAPAVPQESATHTAALRLLRGVRVSLEGLRGLRNLLALPAPASAHLQLTAVDGQRRSAAAVMVPSNRTTAQGTGHAAIVIRSGGIAEWHGPAAVSAWPFAGADASPAPGRRDGPSPPVKTSQGGTGGTKNSQANGLKRGDATRRRGYPGEGRRTSTFNQERTQPRGNQASRNPAAMTGHADAAKESMQNPLKHAIGSYDGGDGYIKRDEPWLPPRPAEVEAPHGRSRSPAGAVVWPAARSDGNLPHGWHATPLEPPRNVSLPVPECIQFDDIRVLSLLVRSRRYQASLMHVCVQPDDSPLFKEWVTLPADSHRGMGRWMVSEAIHEDVPQARRADVIRRFGAAIEPTLETVPTLEPIGTDRLFTLLTMSLLDDPLRREAGNRELPRMQANTFQVVQHTGFDGIQRYYLAYFLHRESGDRIGVRGGFQEIWAGAGDTLGVDDAVHDLRINAPNLDMLVVTLQKLTGLRYLGTRRHAGSQALATPATNLFVDDNQTLSTLWPSQHLPFNHVLKLFAPVTMDLAGHPEPVSLYHESFVLYDDVLIYADAAGQGGVLHFGHHRVQGGARQLRCLTPSDCIFAARHGLLPGVFYQHREVRQALQDSGLINLGEPGADEAIDMHLVPDTSTTPDPWPASLPARSTFRFHDDTLHYVDHDGHVGSMVFARVPRRAVPRYQLPPQPLPAEQVFAARNGFAPETVYSEEEIAWLLGGQGYIRMAD